MQTQLLSQTQRGMAQDRPAKGEPACLLFAQNSITLSEREQGVEPASQQWASSERLAVCCRSGPTIFGLLALNFL